ncbi:retrovirus-related pol polyprotein from transposon TNT 1-94 [Tanacetum coccineum]
MGNQFRQYAGQNVRNLNGYNAVQNVELVGQNGISDPECNNIKLAIWNDKSEVVCAMCKQCLITSNHDVYVFNYVNDINSRVNKFNANVSKTAYQKKHKPKDSKLKKVGSKQRLASSKPRKPRTCLWWSPTGRNIDLKVKIIESSESESQYDCSKGYPNLFMVRRLGLFQAYDHESKASHQFCLKFLGTVRFGNDYVAAILDFDDLQWGNILITRVYFVEGLGRNVFSVGKFRDSDLEVAFRRNTCFIKNREGVYLLKGNCTTNLYTINLHEMAFTSPIFLMARATYTKSWLWHQHLSHFNFDTINDLAKNDLVTGLPKFKYHKKHLCPSCEQRKSKKASHPPNPIPNSKQRLHLLYMDLCGPMRVKSINGKRYVLVIVDDHSHYTWVHFLISKDKAPEEIKIFLKKMTVLLQAPVIIDIGKLGAKGDIGFFIGYSANLLMASEQRSSKPRLQGMTSRQISLKLDLTYAPSTITTQKPTERKLDLLFKAMYDDYIGGQPSAGTRTTSLAPAMITVFLMKAEKLTSVVYFAFKRFRFNWEFDEVWSS